MTEFSSKALTELGEDEYDVLIGREEMGLRVAN
jgi:hypothetical protein